MKKTPVQELIEELKVNDVAHGMYWIKRPNEFFEKYLEKEKEQIIKAMNYGLGNEKEIELGEYYYNQTYNQNK